MGRRRELSLMFLLFCSTIPAISSARQQQILPTEPNYHQKTNAEKHGQDGVTNRISSIYSARAITVSQGIGHGSAAGGGENGGGGRPQAGGGGAAVIPVYAAGSAQAHHRQGRPRNAGNHYENNMGLLVASVLAAIAHLHLVF
ncbi:uncharacterized protein LOC111485159 [Cucurbita maxima]|uniref:Uncharacterized protein LOC111485159 n=1 Tax=Cucurbita maxima TaxID=3661 RepID=A0A6J1JB47_CUCMA|nr:uncharacterized protein LOC111485159 [Cucurbita maxima]